MGFHFIVVNTAINLLEGLDVETMCTSICTPISDRSLSLESNYTCIVSWVYIMLRAMQNLKVCYSMHCSLDSLLSQTGTANKFLSISACSLTSFLSCMSCTVWVNTSEI